MCIMWMVKQLLNEGHDDSIPYILMLIDYGIKFDWSLLQFKQKASFRLIDNFFYSPIIRDIESYMIRNSHGIPHQVTTIITR